MSTPGWSRELQADLSNWLEQTLPNAHVDAMIPEGDPLRTWWDPKPQEYDIHRLVELLCGGNDHLTLLALVQQARTIASLPATLEQRLSKELASIASNARRAALPQAGHYHETFLSYAHEDTERALALKRLLKSRGVHLYRDVERIQPGESITSRLNQVMSSVASAVLLVSHHSSASQWVNKEQQYLLNRRRSTNLLVLPILVDDIPLPEAIADLFTIDLRGYRGEQDNSWAYSRIQPLVEAVLGLGTSQDSNAE